ncbi:MAG TPA: DUF6221 family protein [Acidothermaceae bacterium]
MTELIAWLLEQIDHDDDVGALVGRAFNDGWSGDRRRIVVQCQGWLSDASGSPSAEGPRASFPEAAEVILRLLAAPYADRDGYLQEWRPA